VRVIINADDFGYDSDTAQATIECFGSGSLTSATLMANMPATSEAVAFARTNPQFSFGVHLTYSWTTMERPLCEPNTLPSLVGQNGYFLPSNRLRLAALLGRVSAAEIARETGEQLAFIRDQGVQISHVDSHGHLHKFAPFQEGLRRVLPTFGIRRVRCVQNMYVHSPFSRPTFWLSPLWSRRIRRDFTTTDYMFMPKGPGDSGWPMVISRTLRRQGVLEVGIHPGFQEEWRHHDAVAAQRFASFCRSKGSQLITWNDIA
jgi:predicted glycoside hydrolase/deacetylase ChbG (UPF0249 family)